MVDLLFVRSWWVYLFVAIAYLVFYQGMEKKREAYQEISERLARLEIEKKEVVEENGDLLLQIHSQDDPAYIQMVLMQQLGLVPEGQTKVHFQEE